jgi:hypothetical protein
MYIAGCNTIVMGGNSINVNPSDLMDDLALYTFTSAGTRSPASKLSNVGYVPTGILSPGTAYGYLWVSTGVSAGYRQVWDGSNTGSRAYNGGFVPGSLSWTDYTSSYWATAYQHQGNFVYADNSYSYADGSSLTGFQICGWTQGASDPGKGGLRGYIFNQQDLQDAFNQLYAATGNSCFIWSSGA